MNESLMGRVIACFKKDEGMKTTIIARILRLSIISIICSLIFIILFYEINVSKLITEDYQEQVSNNAEVYSNSVSQWTTLIKHQIENAAKNEKFVDTSLSLDERKAVLAEVAAETEFKDFSIAYSTGKTYNDTDISEREYFKDAMAGNTCISSPVLRKTDNKMTIMVGTKMKTEGFDGILYGGIDVDFFSDLMSGVKLGDTGYGFIVDGEGTIIAHKEADVVTEMLNPIEASKTDSAYSGCATLVSDMISNQSGNGTYQMEDGFEYLVGYQQIPNTEGWSVAILIKRDEAVSKVRKISSESALAGILTVLVTSTSVLFVASGIAYPVRQATDILKKLAAGDLSASGNMKIKSDETGVLISNVEATRKELSGYIGEIGDTLEAITEGDLRIEITEEYKGDFVKIKNSLNHIIDSLNRTFGQTANASANMVEGARQVEMASQALASASTEQASAVVQINASMDGIAKSTSENTADVIKVNELTQTAKAEAVNGNEQMANMVSAMSDISASSQNIAKIMKVIDDISFQTNILALNASVEAARAGVHGKGFAVVADEVRNLAGKSSEAATEIADMIDDTIKKINAGTTIAADTADELKKIVDDIEEIAEVMEHIAEMSREQAESVGQVNSGLDQISAVVQNNSATSEECAASSVELFGQAEGLMKQIKFYKLK